MDTRNNNMPGLSGYTVTHSGTRLWLPLAIAKALEIEKAIADEAATTAKAEAQRAKAYISAKPASPPPDVSDSSNTLGIRVGTNEDLSDATALAERILKKAKTTPRSGHGRVFKELIHCQQPCMSHIQKMFAR